MVPTDTVKYEVDKESGYLKIDRPQKYSNVVPALYGFIPQTFSGPKVADFCMKKSGKKDIKGDADPIDICVLSEKEITHGDILVRARPIGGFRMIDGNESDDKLVAVLNNDAVYMEYYKDLPGNPRDVEITDVFGKEDAYEIIKLSMDDYHRRFENLENLLSSV